MGGPYSYLVLLLPWLSEGSNWGNGPASFDCGMRKLAYSYGKQLLPRTGSFESLYYALDLNDPQCKGDLEPNAGLELGETTPLPKGAFFVDPAKGVDSADGSESAPLKTIQAAIGKAPKAGVVVLRAGFHYVDKAILLGPEHSGMTIRAYPGEKPIVSGGKRVEVSWQPYDVRNGKNIYKASLANQVDDVPGLQLDGARATRARYPNLPGGIEVSPGYGAMIPSNAAKWTPPQFDKFGPVKYYTDNTAEHLRNNTPDNWFQKYMIGIKGLCSVYDPPVGYWCSEHPSGGGAFAFRTPSGVTPSKKALPNSPYKDVSDMVINIWRPARWANWMFEVGHYDPSANNFTFGRGGNQGARGENTGGDFFVENVFEELDNPGEFFFNRSTKDLYLFYNGTGAPPPSMEVVVPQTRVLFNISGSQWNPVRDLTLDGLHFRSTRYTYMDPHGVPSAGDWALDRISAVFLQGTEHVTVQNSVFERLDGNAIMISGYNRNATVQDNDFAYIGGNAMISWGYTNETENTGFPYYTPNTNFPQAGVDGTDGNHPRYNSILRNTAREVGLYEKQSSFYMQAKTAQSTISGNVFFNGPRAGINFNDGFGGGDVLSYNLVFSTCRESGDHGPFNSWDRQPFLTTVRTGQPSMILEWRELHHNFFIDNYSPQEDIDNDDGSAYYKSHHNFLVYGGQGMKNDFGGHDNRHYDNIYAYTGQALGVTKTLQGHEDYFYNNRVVLTGQSSGSPECTGATTQMHSNQYYTHSGSITVCGKSLEEVQAQGLETGSSASKVPADSDLLGWARALLWPSATATTEVVI
eukprot:TRINITY_DN19838_c1_g1_i1.p1 TRINITY_DN19838_c1_g1~~TRINITY_DN19838_c1_g1_i1.p1  ORF type:complete len:805 (-),score=72.35 TRINITY_DN19838_c1_g1_i1:236-2650(-)